MLSLSIYYTNWGLVVGRSIYIGSGFWWVHIGTANGLSGRSLRKYSPHPAPEVIKIHCVWYSSLYYSNLYNQVIKWEQYFATTSQSVIAVIHCLLSSLKDEFPMPKSCSLTCWLKKMEKLPCQTSGQ